MILSCNIAFPISTCPNKMQTKARYHPSPKHQWILSFQVLHFSHSVYLKNSIKFRDLARRDSPPPSFQSIIANKNNHHQVHLTEEFVWISTGTKSWWIPVLEETNNLWQKNIAMFRRSSFQQNSPLGQFLEIISFRLLIKYMQVTVYKCYIRTCI